MAFTFFFRDSHSLEQAAKFLLENIDGQRNIKVWDAGCAMGPEPYTFAILLAEKMGYFSFKKVQVDASDIDETDTFGNIILKGEYPENELVRIPKDIFEKYFAKVENSNNCKLTDNILNRIKFIKHDLLTFKPFDTGYNLIICKNVLLHFQQAERVKVFSMFHSVLAEKGLLVTEQTQELPEENRSQFEKITGDANIYRKI